MCHRQFLCCDLSNTIFIASLIVASSSAETSNLKISFFPVNKMFLQSKTYDGCNQKIEFNVANDATTLHSTIAFFDSNHFFAT
jgi:hypothetical protein